MREKTANSLKELRKKHNMTQEDLGRVLGVKKSNISKYESGAVALPQRTIEILCNYFKISSDALLGIDDFPLKSGQDGYVADRESDGEKYVGVPMLGRVHAGSPMFASENIEYYIPHHEADVAGGEYFYMEVEGDCMTGDSIPEGAFVLVRKQQNANNNDIVVVRIEDEVVLRHIKFMGDSIVLIPSNTAYEPMIITGGDVEIIGKVCEVRFYV